MASTRRNTGKPGRKAMRSPGRPPVANRNQIVQFWQAIAEGRMSDAAGIDAGDHGLKRRSRSAWAK